MHSERRFRVTDRPIDRCRLCWSSIAPDRDHVEYGEELVYYRCPRCLGSFPIRKSDLKSMDPESPR